MKYDELHKLIRDNGWIKIRQMGTSHVIYRKVVGLILFHSIEEGKLVQGLNIRYEKRWNSNDVPVLYKERE